MSRPPTEPQPTSPAPAGDDRPSRSADNTTRSRRRRTAAAVLAVVVGIAAAVHVANRPEPVENEPLVDVFEHVTAQGYQANRSLAGRYAPGDVLQTLEADPTSPEAPRPLATPILALRAEDCFPDLETIASPFPLPRGEAAGTATLGLRGAQVTRTIPGLRIDDSAASSWRLRFERPQVLTLPKLEMSGRFAEQCVDRLDAAVDAGEPIEWFGAIHEAVVADGFRFEVEWSSSASADLDLSLQRTEQALEALAQEAPGTRSASDDTLVTAVQVDSELSSKERTVWSVDARVVLGYRLRPLAALLPEGAQAAAPSGGESAPAEAAFTSSESPFTGRLAILAQAGDVWHRVEASHAFATGERFRFEVESTHAARLFVFHQPPGGTKSELWPGARSDANHIAAGESLTVPPGAFEMQDETGEEVFYVVLAANGQLPKPHGEAVNYVLRGLDRADSRGVGIVDVEELCLDCSWLDFAPTDEDDDLAAVGFRLRHVASE